MDKIWNLDLEHPDLNLDVNLHENICANLHWFSCARECCQNWFVLSSAIPFVNSPTPSPPPFFQEAALDLSTLSAIKVGFPVLFGCNTAPRCWPQDQLIRCHVAVVGERGGTSMIGRGLALFLSVRVGNAGATGGGVIHLGAEQIHRQDNRSP